MKPSHSFVSTLRMRVLNVYYRKLAQKKHNVNRRGFPGGMLYKIFIYCISVQPSDCAGEKIMLA